MPGTDSKSRKVVTILKRLAGALTALIGGLLPVAIVGFIFGLFVMGYFTTPLTSAHQVLHSLLVAVTVALGVTGFAFLAAAPFWLLFYVPCHLLIPCKSVLWKPWLSAPLGAVGGAAAFWIELSVVAWGKNSNYENSSFVVAIMAVCIGTCTWLAGSMIAKRAEKESRPGRP